MTDLDCADDITLMSKDVRCMNRLTEKLTQETGKVRLVMNKMKTKVMGVRPTEDMRKIFLEGEVIEEMEWLEYLGSIACNDGEVCK